MVNIFMIEDHQVVINGFKHMFDNIGGELKLESYALCGIDALNKLKSCKAKVVLLDLGLPDIPGEDLCYQIKTKYPEKRVIVLTGEPDFRILKKAWENGADAILTKTCDSQELFNAIYDVLTGIRIIGRDVPEFSGNLYAEASTSEIVLTRKEKLILELLAEGKTREQVSHMLDTKRNTINVHCRNIFKKFNLSKMIDVVMTAKKMRLLKKK